MEKTPPSFKKYISKLGSIKGCLDSMFIGPGTYYEDLLLEYGFKKLGFKYPSTFLACREVNARHINTISTSLTES